MVVFYMIEIKNSVHDLDGSGFDMKPINIGQVIASYSDRVRTTLENKLDSMYLFGSVARGDYTTVSDIDILLVLNMSDDEIRKTRSALTKIGSDLALEFNVLINKFTASKEDFELNQDIRPLYVNVLKEGVRL